MPNEVNTVINYILDGKYDLATAKLYTIVKTSLENIYNAFNNAVDTLTTGVSMIMDDIKDVGKIDRIHHWMIGLILVVIAVIILIGIAIYLLFNI